MKRLVKELRGSKGLKGTYMYDVYVIYIYIYTDLTKNYQRTVGNVGVVSSPRESDREPDTKIFKEPRLNSLN